MNTLRVERHRRDRPHRVPQEVQHPCWHTGQSKRWQDSKKVRAAGKAMKGSNGESRMAMMMRGRIVEPVLSLRLVRVKMDVLMISMRVRVKMQLSR